MLWTSQEAADATGGRTTRAWAASGVSIDTRTLTPGDLFVALTDLRDGHDFVAAALAAGACAALVSRVPDGLADDAPLLIVEDVLRALEAMAQAARARTGAKVIGVTGSVGKTSTKEMLRAALSGQGIVHAAEKSFNNHWGVPLTLARMPREAEFAVIEIGMNHPGEIAPLARLARLDVAVITTVAAAHLEAFASVQDIAIEKAAIFEGLQDAGTAIVNGDLDQSPVLRAYARGHIMSFGRLAANDWVLQEALVNSDTTVCRATHDGQTLMFKLGAPGTHFAMNALATLAAVAAAGGDLGRAVVALGGWHPPVGRGQRHFISLDAVDASIGIDLFDDAYNANPASVGAALEVLAHAVPPGRGGRRIAILGDMKELGETERDLHRAIADHPALDHIDTLHCVGPLAQVLYEALPAQRRGLRAATSDVLAAMPAKLVRAGDVVMVKGSLSMKMALIVDAVRKLGQAIDLNDKDNR